MSIVEVDCVGVKDNPHCPHGPTIKFVRLVKGKKKTFFACSACRGRKCCPFFLWEGEKLTDSKKLALDDWKKRSFPKIQPEIISQRQEKFKQLDYRKQFCITCFDYVFLGESPAHRGHVLKIVTDTMLHKPSHIITPLTSNKNEAQYWFTPKTIDFLVTNLLRNKFTQVLCIGTPTLFETLKEKFSVECLLLDIDHRYLWFYNNHEFLWFNMFNFHFFIDEYKCLNKLKDFLKNSNALVVIDPPFGARTEPLKNTIQELQQFGANSLKTMLILPYFMEPQVLKSFKDFKMLDFPVEYINHKKFGEKSSDPLCDNKGSPVRIFTDISCKYFEFPKNEKYHFCEKCKAWRCKNNLHCEKCNVCPSKNGDKYWHCSKCQKCVKPTWKHCEACRICCLPDHECCCSSSQKVEEAKRKKRNWATVNKKKK